MEKITVLGGGMVGSAIAIDLSKQFDVTLADINRQRLNELEEKYNFKTVQADLSKSDVVKKVIKDCDLVIGAVPGFMGYQTIKTVIEEGKDVVDISFFDEDPFTLDELAKEKNVTAIIDCGVAPGMSNIILGYYNQLMQVDEFEFMVGGLPFKRTLPFQYKAPFSPIDVIEEYTRPARVVESGKIVSKPALSDAEMIEVEPIGTLEAFNTDGLRTLLKTMKIPNMKEKTLRYPGHIKYMKMLRDSGFFDKNEIEVNGKNLRPLDFTAQLLFPKWKLEKEEAEFTVMQVKIKGKEQGVEKEYIYNLFDKFDEKTKISSMARTTGYTCTAAARLVLNGSYKSKGISPPEYLGADANCFNAILEDLKNHDVTYTVTSK